MGELTPLRMTQVGFDRSDPGIELDKRYEERFHDEICRIVGPLLLWPAPLGADRRGNTDFYMLQARDLRIACRIRRPGAAQKYPDQFTIRYARRSGVDTEIHKIYKGFGDLMFYGHEAECEGRIDSWMVVDLDAFRVHAHNLGKELWHEIKENNDGTSFIVFDVTRFPPCPNILLGRS